MIALQGIHNIEQLLGDKIIDIRMFYESQGKNDWLDYVLTFIKLEKKGIVILLTFVPFPRCLQHAASRKS